MSSLISVIVPVYNVEDYLDRCVESIVNQSYSNLEIILVDDGSTDRCPEMCDNWAIKESRIKVIHKENGGQASARNSALEIALGKCIGFVDSDDYIDIEMYNTMYNIMVDNDCDIVECTKCDFFEDEKCITNGSGEFILFDQSKAIQDFLKETHLKCTVWSMLVKAEIAKRVCFDDGKTHEDILWPYRAYMLAERIAYVDKAFYHYFQRPGSTMNKKYSEKRFDGLDALEERARLVKIDYPQYYHLATKSYLGACMYQYQYLSRQPKNDDYKRYKSILHKRFCSGDQQTLFDGLSLKYKLWYSLFRVAPSFTSKIRNVLKVGI